MIVSQLVSAGIPRVRAQRGAFECGNESVAAATRWCNLHHNHPDIDTPLVTVLTRLAAAATAATAPPPDISDSSVGRGKSKRSAAERLGEKLVGAAMKGDLATFSRYPEADVAAALATCGEQAFRRVAEVGHVKLVRFFLLPHGAQKGAKKRAAYAKHQFER